MAAGFRCKTTPTREAVSVAIASAEAESATQFGTVQTDRFVCASSIRSSLKQRRIGSSQFPLLLGSLKRRAVGEKMVSESFQHFKGLYYNAVPPVTMTWPRGRRQFTKGETMNWELTNQVRSVQIN